MKPAVAQWSFFLRIGCHFNTREGISGWRWAWASLSRKSWHRAAADKEQWFVHSDCSGVWEWGVWSSCWLMESLVWSNYWHIMVSGTNGLCLGWGNNTSNPACSGYPAMPRERQFPSCMGQLEVGLIFGLISGRVCECFRCCGKCSVI